MKYPKLEVTWNERDPIATKWKYLCKIIGHQFRPSHPHLTFCNRCGMEGDEYFVRPKEIDDRHE